MDSSPSASVPPAVSLGVGRLARALPPLLPEISGGNSETQLQNSHSGGGGEGTKAAKPVLFLIPLSGKKRKPQV